MSDINEMNVGTRWYVAHTFTGYENKVKTSLENIIQNQGLQNLFFDIVIPMDVHEETKKDGSIKQVEKRIFPGYVFIKMIMTDESWHAVRNITGSTGFVGPGSRPVPLTDAEVEKLHLEGDTPIESKAVVLQVGDRVRIIKDLFEGFEGVIQSISDDGKTAVILVERGRRPMPVEMSLDIVKKIPG